MPIVELKPSPRARLPMVSASCGFFTPPPDHRIDVHVEVGMFGEQLQFLVQNLQAFLRDFVRSHVVDRNLQPLQAGPVEALNTLRHQKIAIRDQPGDHAPLANATDNLIEFRMQQRLAAADRNHRRPQRSQLVHSLKHHFGGHGLRKIVVFVAVLAGQVAAPYGNDMRQQRMVRRSERARDHARPPQIAMEGLQTAAHCSSCRRHGY